VYKQYTTTANQNHSITTTKKLLTVLCDVMQNNPVNTHQHYKEPTAFILRVEDRDSRLLCNVGMHIQDHMAPGVSPKTAVFMQLPLREDQISQRTAMYTSKFIFIQNIHR
jgi:hypothetical protein